MSATIAERLAERRAEPGAVRVVRQGLSGDHLRPAGDRRALPGDRPARGREPGRGGAKLFRPVGADPEPRPARGREARRPAGSPAGCCSSICPRARKGRDRLHTRLDHPEWPHVAILAGSVQAGGTDRSRRCRSTTSIWRLFHEEDEVRTLAAIPLTRGLPLRSRLCPLGDRALPGRGAAAMVGDDGLIRVDCAFCSSSFPIAPTKLS